MLDSVVSMTTTTPQAERNRALVLGALAAVTKGDTETFLEAMHPELVVHEPDYLPYGGDFHGAEGFLHLLGEVAKLVDIGSLELVSAIADDDRVVLLMTVALRSSGERRHLTEHWLVEAGRVRDVRVFWSDLP
jgi:ketosteroid isomerase-like protein